MSSTVVNDALTSSLRTSVLQSSLVVHRRRIRCFHLRPPTITNVVLCVIDWYLTTFSKCTPMCVSRRKVRQLKHWWKKYKRERRPKPKWRKFSFHERHEKRLPPIWSKRIARRRRVPPVECKWLSLVWRINTGMNAALLKSDSIWLFSVIFPLCSMYHTRSLI